MRMVGKRAAPRRCELRGERPAGWNRRHDAVTDAAEAGHTIRKALDLQAVPVYAARLIEIVLHDDPYRLAALELEDGSRKHDGILRWHAGALLQHEPVGGLPADETV